VAQPRSSGAATPLFSANGHAVVSVPARGLRVDAVLAGTGRRGIETRRGLCLGIVHSVQFAPIQLFLGFHHALPDCTLSARYRGCPAQSQTALSQTALRAVRLPVMAGALRANLFPRQGAAETSGAIRTRQIICRKGPKRVCHKGVGAFAGKFQASKPRTTAGASNSCTRRRRWRGRAEGGLLKGPGSAAHHFVLRCARDTRLT
jgi:hypothetical protein